MLQIRSTAAALLVMSSIAFAQGTGANTKAVQPGEPATRPAESPETKAVRDAARGFAMLLSAEDFEAVKAAFGGSKEDLEIMRSWHGATQAGRAFVAAVDKKFPPAPGTPPMTLEYMKDQIDVAPITISGDAAVVQQTFKLRKTDGKWKVVDVSPEDKPLVASAVLVLTKAADEVRAGVEKDQYKTREEANDAFCTAVEEGIEAADAARQRAAGYKTAPATMPAPAPESP
jgi:hypothetical protein